MFDKYTFGRSVSCNARDTLHSRKFIDSDNEFCVGSRKFRNLMTSHVSAERRCDCCTISPELKIIAPQIIDVDQVTLDGFK